MAEYFSPTIFSPAVLGWDLANARFGLGTSRMPMRGKLRCSFRCTLILSWIFVVWNKFAILSQRDSRTNLPRVQFCMRNCPANPASSSGPVWKLPREGAQWRGKLLRVLPNTVGFARLVKLSFFMAATIYFEIFEQNVVFVHAKCVTKHREGAAYGRTGTSPCSLGQTETPNSLDLPMAGPRLQLRRTSLPMAGPKHQIRRTSLPIAGPIHQIRRTSLPMAGPWDKLTCAPSDLPAYGRTGHPLWNLQSYWMAGRGAAAENMDTEKNLEAALFSLFLSH